MRNYETVFILDPTIGDERTAQEVERAKSAVESANGEMVDIQRWGKRKLAYEIRKKREGIYTVLKYKSDGQAVSELERSLRLSEPVLRFLTVQDELGAGEDKDLAAGTPESYEAGTASEEGEEGGAVAESPDDESESNDSGRMGFAREPGSQPQEPEPERPTGEDQPSEGETPEEDSSTPEGLPKP